MSEREPKKVPAEAEAEAEAGSSKLGWLVGWVLVPAMVALTLFGLGAYVGAHHPASWVTRLVRWFVE